MKSNEEQPKYLYKILTREEWINNKSILIGSSLDIKDGFIHLSTAKQAKKIANKYFPGMSDGYLLQILYSKIKSSIKWEANSKGELFAHYYGEIPVDNILAATPLSVETFDFDKLDY